MNDNSISTTVSNDLDRRLRILAAKFGTSKAEIMRVALGQFCDNVEKEIEGAGPNLSLAQLRK